MLVACTTDCPLPTEVSTFHNCLPQMQRYPNLSDTLAHPVSQKLLAAHQICACLLVASSRPDRPPATEVSAFPLWPLPASDATLAHLQETIRQKKFSDIVWIW